MNLFEEATMSFKVFYTDDNNKVVIQRTIEEETKTTKIDRNVYDAISVISEPVSNGELQRIIATALGVSTAGGRSGKASAIIEKYTFGFSNFNGWCALLIGVNIGGKRHFKFNDNAPDFSPVVKTEMLNSKLTKTEQLAIQVQPALSTVQSRWHIDVSTLTEEQVLDARFNRAFDYLGIDPNDNSSDDLTLEDVERIEKVLKKEGLI
jgi:hypothetical protein